MLSKISQEYTIYNSFHIKFKGRQNSYMVIVQKELFNTAGLKLLSSERLVCKAGLLADVGTWLLYTDIKISSN